MPPFRRGVQVEQVEQTADCPLGFKLSETTEKAFSKPTSEDPEKNCKKAPRTQPTTCIHAAVDEISESMTYLRIKPGTSSATSSW